MVSFEKETLRDPQYRKRLEEILDRIRQVRQAHSYVAYAANRFLLDEWESVYRENLQHYQEDYQANLRAYQDLVDEIAENRSALPPSRLRELQSHYGAIEEKLAAPSYEINRQAGKEIQDLRKHFEEQLAALHNRSQALALVRQEMKSLMTQIWAEDYGRLKSAYQELRDSEAPLEGFPDPEAVQILKHSREADIAALQQKLKGRKRLLRKVESLAGTYYHRSDFLALQKRLLRSQQIRRFALWAGGVLVLSLLALGLLAYPRLRKIYQEQEMWEQAQHLDTWEAYEQYLGQYPEGKFSQKAREAMLLLPYGHLKSFHDPEGRTLDYEGELDAGVPYGQGSATYENGDHYDGAWRSGSPYGHGAMNYADGSSYTGEWQAGVRHGSGTFTSAQNDIYTGEWQYNKRHGDGTLLYANGSKYLGQWENDYPEGQGTFIASEDLKGQKPGWQPGSNYTGSWHEGLRHGTGTYKVPGGPMFQGKWVEGQQEGKGTLLWPDGSSFRGTWANGTIDGEGVFRSRLREEISGIWKGQPADIRLYDESGNLIRHGKWENGLFISN